MFAGQLSTQPQVLVTMFDDSTVAASLGLRASCVQPACA